jgi:hypothetical protein
MLPEEITPYQALGFSENSAVTTAHARQTVVRDSGETRAASAQYRMHESGPPIAVLLRSRKRCRMISGGLNRGINMRIAVILASVAAISVTVFSADAQARGCGIRCLEQRIAGLEAQIAQLNAIAVKSGQPVTINAPGGCLSWVGPNPGAVGWVAPPCFDSTWVISGH